MTDSTQTENQDGSQPTTSALPNEQEGVLPVDAATAVVQSTTPPESNNVPPNGSGQGEATGSPSTQPASDSPEDDRSLADRVAALEAWKSAIDGVVYD